MTIRHVGTSLFAASLLLLGIQTAFAAIPTPFTATYNVLQQGSPMGEATVTLRPAGDGEWIFSKAVKGTSGMAVALGASTSETSRFRWKNGMPEAISYDYQLTSSFKSKQRHLAVDWSKNQVTVDDGKGPTNFQASPGLVERNTLSLAIAAALNAGQQQAVLPVAVKQGIQNQSFKVTGTESVVVPAGSFNAARVDRTDADRGFSAWYLPGRYPVPVKLSQHDGGDLELDLVSYRPQ